MFFIFGKFGAAHQLCGILALDPAVCYNVRANVHSVGVDFSRDFNEVSMMINWFNPFLLPFVIFIVNILITVTQANNPKSKFARIHQESHLQKFFHF